MNHIALWTGDLDRTLETVPWISGLAGSSVMITGAGGLVCSSVADLLIRYNETHPAPVRIIAAGRSEKRIRERFGEYAERPYFTFAPYDATKAGVDIPVRPDYIIHGAGNSSPDLIAREPVETMAGNFSGLYYLLEYARENAVKRLLYISSSEVYGKKESPDPFREGQYGYIDLLVPRNSYAVGKRAAETLCVSFAAEYGVESVIVRPGHVYGPAAAERDRHVSVQWAYDAARGKDIVMKSDGGQVRSYCYCLDVASAILTVLLRGQSGQAYNISDPGAVISIRQMAEIMADIAGVQLRTEAAAENEMKIFNPMSNSSLDGSSLAGLGWKAVVDAGTGLEHTIRILKERIREEKQDGMGR